MSDVSGSRRLTWFRNGSLAANGLLLLAGGLIGVGGQRWWAPAVTGSGETALLPGAASPEPGALRSAGLSTVQQASGHALKLEQILAANNAAHKAEDLSRLGREMAGSDPISAIGFAKQIPGSQDRLAFLRGVFETWAATDPAAAAAYAKAHFKPGQLLSETIRVTIDQWAVQDPRAAFLWLDSELVGAVKEEAIVTLGQSWARQAPQAAAAWFEQSGSTSQALLQAITTAWSENDPAAAATWARAMKNPENRLIAIQSALGEWAGQDPQAVLGFLKPLLAEAQSGTPGSLSTTDLLVPLLPALLKEAPTTAASEPSGAKAAPPAYPEGWPPLESSPELVGPYVTEAMQTMPDAMKTWSESIASPALREAVIGYIAPFLGATDPMGAVAWLDQQPPQLTGAAYPGAFNTWAATDAAGMQQWIGTQAGSPTLDTARRSLGDVLSGSDILAALQLGQGMTNPVQQADAVGDWFRTLRRADDATAQEWITREWCHCSDATKGRLQLEQTRAVATP
jgi:hypothetical protein